MVKKGPAAAPAKKARVEGQGDITRFFSGAHARQEDGAGPPAASQDQEQAVTGAALQAAAAAPGAHACAAAAAGHRQVAALLACALPAESVSPKLGRCIGVSCITDGSSAQSAALAALQYAPSQDTDALRVVWQDSPGSSHSPGSAAAGAAARATASSSQSYGALKRRLACAAALRGGGGGGGGGGGASGSGGLAAAPRAAAPALEASTLLEELGLFPGRASSAPTDEGQPAPAAVAVQHTPGAGLRGILRAGSGGLAAGAEAAAAGALRRTPASCVRFRLSHSGGRPPAARTATKSGLKQGSGGRSGPGCRARRAGQKRRALLDLLEQVETMVQGGGASAQGFQPNEPANKENSGSPPAASSPPTFMQPAAPAKVLPPSTQLAGCPAQQPATHPPSQPPAAGVGPGTVPDPAQAAPGQRALPPSPYGPPPAAGQPPPTGVAAMDDDWGDDVDAGLLDQFEAAALAERAQRGLAGEPSSSAALPAAAGAAAAAQPPPEGEQPAELAAPVAAAQLAGDRRRVHYVIEQLFDQGGEQVLLLRSTHQERRVYAHLRSPWADGGYRVGDPVALLADLDLFEGRWHALLDMERGGLLVHHPDLLLSGTRITASHECVRLSVLDEKVPQAGTNDKALKGTLQHTLIQAALSERLSAAQLHARADVIVADAAEALLEAGMTEEAARECLHGAVPGIVRFMARFLRAEPAPDAVLSGGYDVVANTEVQRTVAIQEVEDIEESIWSTKFGIKGMVDASVRLALAPPPRLRAPPRPAGFLQLGAAGGGAAAGGAGGTAEGTDLVVAPLEIKTGKPHGSHRAQVLLYLLLMEERYGTPLHWGVLWYTGRSDPELVRRQPHELAALMAVRNRLASYLAHGQMPALVDDKRCCRWCFQKETCALVHRAVEGGDREGFGRPSAERALPAGPPLESAATAVYDAHAAHLTPEDCAFLKKWDRLLALEEAGSTSRRPEIWSMTGKQREKLGRCVAGLTLVEADAEQRAYTFARTEDSSAGPSVAGGSGGGADGEGGGGDGDLGSCSFNEGEMVVLSVEGQHVAVARGYFCSASATRLTLSLQRPLREGLMAPREGAPPLRWRVDRDDVSGTFGRLRGALFSLFRRRVAADGVEEGGSARAARLRRLVVDLEAPAFGSPASSQASAAAALSGLNAGQRAAVASALAAQDYALILGMPGAGKTTAIAALVAALVAAGQSVLVTSYTNSAVDTILSKLAAQAVPFVRLGREAGVRPDLRQFLPGGQRWPARGAAALRRLASEAPVFGATCFGASHPLLRERGLVDVCIVDEAGQVTLPATLGPLLRARRFVLVGDTHQLPPLVTSKQAEAEGLGVSLFARLAEAHPEAVATLAEQYRMASDIADLANCLVYGGGLRCGSDAVARGTMALPPSAAAPLAALPAWLRRVFDPEARVLFLDTAALPRAAAEESVAGDAVRNEGEARVALRVLRAAAALGLPPASFGLISPYRSQAALLDQSLRAEPGLTGAEALTVDKCQGRDWDAVLLSLVRSNAERDAGKLLRDARRVNVAVTRARHKLLLVGDASTLASAEPLARLLGLVRQRGWLLALPPEAAEGPAG